MRNLDAGLVSVPYVNNSDLVSEERGRRYEAARDFVRAKQCAARSANPLLLTSLPLNVRLTGNLGRDGRIEFSGAKTEGIVGSTRLVSDQGVEMMLRVSTLSELPNEYLKEMSALLQAKGLPDEIVQKLRKEVPATYEALTLRVGKLVNDFDVSSCGRLEAKGPANPKVQAPTPVQAASPEKPRPQAATPERPRQAQRSLTVLALPTF